MGKIFNELNYCFLALPFSRFSTASVTGMIQDLFMLAKADFTVCSYTSNVGLKRAKPKKFAQIVRKVADDKDCSTDLSDAL